MCACVCVCVSVKAIRVGVGGAVVGFGGAVVGVDLQAGEFLVVIPFPVAEHEGQFELIFFLI